LPANLVRVLPEGAEILGRTDPQDFFSKVDVLIHPANDEPFGMVMSESLTCGVPVVFSDQCGAANHLRSDGLRILRIDAPVADWARACSEIAGRTFTPPPSRTWSDVAVDHESLYEQILKTSG
jgi:UDP-glucose:(heptosyl)LPS alpha-1,3-glucosyltransferase